MRRVAWSSTMYDAVEYVVRRVICPKAPFCVWSKYPRTMAAARTAASSSSQPNPSSDSTWKCSRRRRREAVTLGAGSGNTSITAPTRLGERLPLPFECGIGEGRIEEEFGRVEAGDLVSEDGEGVFPFDLGAQELTGGEIAGGDSVDPARDREQTLLCGRLVRLMSGLEAGARRARAVATGDGDQEIVLPLLEHARFEEGPRRKDADDFAADDAFGLFRILDLFAEGDFVSRGDQLGDVPFDRMVRHAAHGDPPAFPGFPRGQRDLEEPRSQHGVVVEHLIKIPEAKEEDAPRVLTLDVVILAEHGCEALHRRAHLLTAEGSPRRWRAPPAAGSGIARQEAELIIAASSSSQ